MAKSAGAKMSGAKATVRMTIEGEGLAPDLKTAGKLPGPLLRDELQKLVVKLQKSKQGLLGDQRRKLVSSMGCVSNPGGPGC
jgi:hypothetical protein